MSTVVQQDGQATANNIDEQNTIIVELCAGAPTDVVRDCLRKYDPRKTAYQIERELKKDKKVILVAALEYLVCLA